MCTKHYRYWLDHTPLGERSTAPRFVDDFWDHVRKSHERGCWTWTGSASRQGYGYWHGKLAHREAWRRANGEITGQLWVLHHCDNPPCVNPAHLYLGTVVENARDMVERRRQYIPPLKTHCDKGHELAGDNVRLMGRRKKRCCRVCDNERSAQRQREKRRAQGVQPANFVSMQERALMTELRQGGMTQRAIAVELGRGIATVQRVLREGVVSGG